MDFVLQLLGLFLCMGLVVLAVAGLTYAGKPYRPKRPAVKSRQPSRQRKASSRQFESTRADSAGWLESTPPQRSRRQAEDLGGQSPNVVTDIDGVKRVDARGCVRKSSTPLRPRDVAGLSPAAWREMLEAFGRKCRYCAVLLGDRPEKDHRQPLAAGGRNEAANIVPACGRCNRYKSLSSEDQYAEWMRDLAGNGGWKPPEAAALLRRLASSSQGREDRQHTLLKVALARASHWKPYAKPTTAVLLDPPALDKYSASQGDWWLRDGSPIAGISYQESNVKALTGSSGQWGGWGFLLPEPHNSHDPSAVAVFAQGRKLGYLPKGAYPGVRTAARRCWDAGQLPVVRVALWTSQHIGGRVHVGSGYVTSNV